VRADLMTALDRLAPRDAGYVHSTEGPDDMPAHIRTMLSGVSVSIPVVDGQMVLGTWQGVYLAEHRDRPHTRDLIVHLIGA
jgi:secondary thiamine-phosphate synthase enzyme